MNTRKTVYEKLFSNQTTELAKHEVELEWYFLCFLEYLLYNCYLIRMLNSFRTIK